MDNKEKNQTPPVGTGPGSSGIENADMDRDMTADAETDKSAEAPGNDPAKAGKSDEPGVQEQKERGDNGQGQ